MALGVVLRMQNTRRYIIFDVHQIHFNLIRGEGDGRHAILNMHNLWVSLGFYYPDPLYFRNALCYIIINLYLRLRRHSPERWGVIMKKCSIN